MCKRGLITEQINSGHQWRVLSVAKVETGSVLCRVPMWSCCPPPITPLQTTVYRSCRHMVDLKQHVKTIAAQLRCCNLLFSQLGGAQSNSN